MPYQRTLVCVCLPILLAADWPQWRGPNRDGISADAPPLPAWSEAGPKLLWKQTELLGGYSSVSVVAGRIYTQGSNATEEFAIALDEKTGAILWKTPIGKVGENRGPQYPGTRATPTVDGEFLYCLASDGELTCLTTQGKAVWQKNFVRDFGGKVGNWAYTESVLIDGDRLIATPGGDRATLVALEKRTGKTVWESAIPGGDLADYASIMAVTVGDRKQYVQYLRKALVGVDAQTGKFLWNYTATQDQGASILTPIVQGNRVFVSGSRKGGGLVELTPSANGVTAKEIYFDKAIAPSIGGAVLLNGYLYGTAGVGMFCADFATGKVLWTERGVGPASVCAVGGKIIARGYNSGDVALIDPSPEGYREVSRFKQPDRSKVQAWPHPVVANGVLYLRDQGVLLAYAVGQ